MNTNSPKLQQALICDDVRKEITGKEIIIGVYGEDLLTPQFPITIFLSLWVRLFFPESGTFLLDFDITGPDGRHLANPQKVPVMAHRGQRLSTIHISNIPLQIQVPGQVQFRWRPEGGEWEKVATLNVMQGPIEVPPGVTLGKPISS